ncbi:aminopeptidase P, Metallo peptidase, MEROPS family M24B [Nitrosococcus oceani ATCC 19707]|uniref:Xaa-Pro aminopeptidase n=2 Tax=Nitrosococcus oceani TaxID=1229 RepID=Q3J814_NITOC|nr:Xaa-Pro aminopeptidase [Nitrosococcus oceani]ABA59032.1 aminopeptidase P, Metallo peptidase, MEROPS family M24B [Nitrosococcus oceani ATCC 19707]EDZ65296.1 peptidase, M24 family [Nitrosococcus oceani AFC27]KFI18555.1 Xaa-Pro aminopeptidase [Nitrosococcus oceani C-27]GEM21205.1 Xaa-Pro aminopeptidase [Nitrosococcus oceani]
MEAKEFARRRKHLLQMMGEGSIAILPTASIYPRNRDVMFPFRADSDFYYLTGFPEPEAVAVFAPGRKHGEYLLFCREQDPEKEIWEGRRAGTQGACKNYGADDSFPITDIDDILPGLLEDKARVYYAMGYYPAFDQRMIGWVNHIRRASRAGKRPPGEFIALDHLLHEMRLIKSAQEIRTMREAARISAKAHIRAMENCHPGIMEYQIEAEYLHHFFSHGCRAPAYPSIVGSGGNACILHYTDNNARLKKGDLLLVDAGAEYDYYAADITRTFPVSGRFSSAQRAIYELVLEAQLAAIAEVQPGNHWNQPHEAAVRVLTEGLAALGLLKGRVSTLLKKEHYRRFYMHRTGHWLGMDVHDVGDYKVDGEWRAFEPGMTLTVEPGVYIPADSQGVAKKWWNIGVRIEDDVLVTKEGCELLSADVPKTVDEIEALMASSQRGASAS